jgi:hypothetical protein
MINKKTDKPIKFAKKEKRERPARSPYKIKLCGGATLLIIFISAFTGGMYGTWKTQDEICGDLEFYFKQTNDVNDKDNLIVLRGCQGPRKLKTGN